MQNLEHACVKAALLTAVLCCPVAADGGEENEGTASPRFATIVRIDKDADHLVYRETRMAPVVEERMVLRGEKKIKETFRKQVPLTINRAFSLEHGCQAYDSQENKLNKDAFWKRVAVNDTVLVSTDRKKAHPKYLKVVKEGTVILVCPEIVPFPEHLAK